MQPLQSYHSPAAYLVEMHFREGREDAEEKNL